MANIFEQLVELVEDTMQSIEFDLLVSELPLGFTRSGLLLLFIGGDPFHGLFELGKDFFLDLFALMKVLGLVSGTLKLLYCRPLVLMSAANSVSFECAASTRLAARPTAAS